MGNTGSPNSDIKRRAKWSASAHALEKVEELRRNHPGGKWTPAQSEAADAALVAWCEEEGTDIVYTTTEDDRTRIKKLMRLLRYMQCQYA